jgi:2,4-dienoyl-CoA reductase-like NADH-dependent reductase (Old Yellow Enzyme family)
VNRFPTLFSPMKIGSMEIANRIVHEPTDTSSSHADGSVSARDIRHHELIAQGGAGLIIVGATTPDASTGRPTVNCLVADGDNYIPGLARLAEAMHRHGAKCMVQLQHPGPKSSLPKTDMFTTNDRISRLFWGSGREIVHGGGKAKGTVARRMSTDEVLDMVELFSEAAWRVAQAGFDGVQLHAAHGYLIS